MDDPTVPVLTVGQVSAMLDVQPAFLRRLDEQGVVSPERSGGNQRRYSREQVERVEAVRELADSGLTLPGIRMVLALQARVAELEAELARLRSQLSGTRPGQD
jgi:MerR family transcriptional regulator/heat shock protein HspR